MAWASDLRLRYKLLLSYASVFVLAIALGGAVVYSLVRRTIEQNLEDELSNSTTAIFNLVRTSAGVAIKNHLRATAEKNREILAHFHRQQTQGLLSEAEAKRRATEILLGQRIGKTGYIYCINSAGVVVVHPSASLLGVDVSDHAFVREQRARREGYEEYDWQNPGEARPRPKALYMTYFAPWDWIISVSAYREEFKELVAVEDFRKSILSLKFGRTGYSFVVDGRGNIVVHPLLQGTNIMGLSDVPPRFLSEMLERKNGKIVYSWKNPGESEPRKKLVIFNYLPEYDWVVASSGYLDEFYAPLAALRNIVLATVFSSLLLVLPLTFRISSSITKPLKELADRLADGEAGDFSARLTVPHRDEVGQLAAHFNTFMERLEEHSASLRRLEREVIEIEDRERTRIGQDLHDDLGPHLIGIEVLGKVLKKRLEDKGIEEAAQAEKIRSLTIEAIGKTRAMAKGLCPVHLADSGLGFALRELTETTELIFGVRCVFGADEPAAVDDKAVATQLYYIAREALHNAVKHAGASRIAVELKRRGGGLCLTVRDDGCGLPEEARRRGMGLHIMGFRAEMIGASLEVRGDAGQGTTVAVTVGQDLPFDTRAG